MHTIRTRSEPIRNIPVAVRIMVPVNTLPQVDLPTIIATDHRRPTAMIQTRSMAPSDRHTTAADRRTTATPAIVIATARGRRRMSDVKRAIEHDRRQLHRLVTPHDIQTRHRPVIGRQRYQAMDSSMIADQVARKRLPGSVHHLAVNRGNRPMHTANVLLYRCLTW